MYLAFVINKREREMEELAQRHRIQSRRSKERRAIVLSRIDRLNGLAAKVIGREIAKPVVRFISAIF